NDLAVADVPEVPLMAWVLASGLTQEELVDIQLPAPPLTNRPLPKVQQVAQKPENLVIDPPGAIAEAQMDAIVRAHVAEVEARLRASTEASLDVAVTRYMAAFASS